MCSCIKGYHDNNGDILDCESKDYNIIYICNIIKNILYLKYIEC